MSTPLLITLAFSLLWTLLILRACTPARPQNRRGGRLAKWLAFHRTLQ